MVKRIKNSICSAHCGTWSPHQQLYQETFVTISSAVCSRVRASCSAASAAFALEPWKPQASFSTLWPQNVHCGLTVTGGNSLESVSLPSLPVDPGQSGGLEPLCGIRTSFTSELVSG